MIKKAGMGVVAALGCAAVLAVPVMAQELSEKSVKTFMNYAWSLVPSQFTPPSGKTIIIDKKKKDEIVVPVEIAREVIKIGRISAHAQICDLRDEQVCNYQSLMKREMDKKSWTEQQLVYISQLHLTTVMLLTGKIKLVEKDGDKEVVVEEKEAPGAKQTCTQEQKEKVAEVIRAYVSSGPELGFEACRALAGKQ